MSAGPWRRVLRWSVAALLAPAITVMLLGAMVVWLLRPAPGEWRLAVPLGHGAVTVSGSAAWRVASHPFVLTLLSGRTWQTPVGPVRWDRAADPGQSWVAVCEPCTVRRPEWGGQALALGRVAVTLAHGDAGRAAGTVVLGRAGQTVQGRWHWQLRPDGVDLRAEWRGVRLADAYAVVERSVPEVAHARITGQFDLDARLALPSGALTLAPRVEGFQVSGLGTRALLGASNGCGTTPAQGFGRWLPRAVIAAEDQRFLTHTGFDLTEFSAAWSLNQGRGTVVRGASTLSQQLAKLLYTGHDRSPVRKLRELLYAVELDRELGKARVLALYLSVAPWGDGRCGADAAARHLLGKPASRLSPVEAAWLASLLRAPDGALARLREGHAVDTARVTWILEQMRPLPSAAGRAAALGWRPAVRGLETARPTPISERGSMHDPARRTFP